MASGEFAFDGIDALQYYYDFRKDDDPLNDSSFFDSKEEVPPPPANHCPKLYEGVDEPEPHETSDPEEDCFYTPIENSQPSNSLIYLKSALRRSLSMNNLPVDPKPSHATDEVNVDVKQSSLLGTKLSRVPSQDHINRLAQPKRFTSIENLHKQDGMTLAEAVIKFQSGTPKRFRSKPLLNKGATIPHSPKLMTTTRVRPVSALSREEKEIKEFEEAKKFKIKANPINRKIFKGPLKPPVDKKPSTLVEPFHLTEMQKKNTVKEQPQLPAFKARPVPKSLKDPFKVQPTNQPATKGCSPNFSKRISKYTPNKTIQPEEDGNKIQAFKPTKTLPKPFSFEKRDLDRMKKKEEFINKVLEEERKAREFHARPPPKAILRSRNNSQETISETGSTKSFKHSTEELNNQGFKAKPAIVLLKKPFVPRKDDNHCVHIEEFQFSTNQRVEARQKFEEKLKEKEAMAEAHKKEQEEILKRLHEEEIARLRKQAEHKAQPIKKYKEVVVQPSKKLTEPISPKFHTDKIRNKENIEQ